MPSLHFHEAGNGFPMVFLHGFCETSEIWKDFITPLAENFHIYTPDLPGCGKSESITGAFSIDDIADSVAHWISETKISKCLLIGHSMGGYVTLALAALHPGLVKGIGLFHSTSFTDSEEKKENRNRVIEFVRKNGVAAYIDTFVPGLFFDKKNTNIQEAYRIASQTSQDTLIGYLQAMRDRPDRSLVLTNDELYKLLIVGRRDTIIPLDSSMKMAEMSSNCRFYELEGVGHMGFFEAKTECQGIIRDFASSLMNNK